GRSPDLLPRSLAQEAPQQAPPAAARVRYPAGPETRPRRAPAPGDRLAGLCRTDVGRARRHARPAQPRRPARPRAASGLAAADPLRDPRPAAGAWRVGSSLRP